MQFGKALARGGICDNHGIRPTQNESSISRFCEVPDDIQTGFILGGQFMKYNIIFMRTDKVIGMGKTNIIPKVKSEILIDGKWLEVFSVETRHYIKRGLFGYKITSCYVVDVFHNTAKYGVEK